MKINANIPALQAARHMNRTNDKIQNSLKKLSSGYKINSVEDDPTGTAVSSKIKAQLYGLKLAGRNALDGVSLVQTAEGAMSEVHEMLKRMRELSVQAVNDTNVPEDRLKIQVEIDQLLDAIDQTADVTEFNQMKLLNGRLSNLTTITDNDAVPNKSYDLTVRYMSSSFPPGDYQLDITPPAKWCAEVTASYSYGAGDIKLNDEEVEILATDGDAEIQNKIKELADRYNCKVSFSGNSFTLTAMEAGSNVSLDLGGTNAVNPSPKPATVTDAVVQLTRKGDDASNPDLGFTVAAVAKVEGNRIIITESGGAQIQIDIASVGANGVYNIKIEDKGQLKLQTGANEDQMTNLMIPGLSTYALGLRKQSFANPAINEDVNLVNVKNGKGAERSIALLDEAVSKVSGMRAVLGAYQNRLEHTVQSIDISSVNTEESLSRIQDTDMAVEMSKYTLNNVILQSAIAMLSQANERPQQLLQLLR